MILSLVSGSKNMYVSCVEGEDVGRVASVATGGTMDELMVKGEKEPDLLEDIQW